MTSHVAQAREAVEALEAIEEEVNDNCDATLKPDEVAERMRNAVAIYCAMEVANVLRDIDRSLEDLRGALKS